MDAHIIFGIVAIVCFIAEAAGISFGRLSLLALGLAFLTAAVLFV
jgi:hypothetical protein